MKNLLIAGAGGHGKVVAEVAEAMGKWKNIAFVDDKHAILNGHLKWPVIDSINNAHMYVEKYKDIVVAIGENELRIKLLNYFVEQGFSLPVLIQPGSTISPTCSLGEGSVVFSQVAINAEAKIGRGCIINTASSIDHDCNIEDGVHICPGTHLGGQVSIGTLSWVGIGSSIIQQINIGKAVTIGAGSVVINDISDDLTVFGIPAKDIDNK